MSTSRVASLGEYLRDQRKVAQLSLRQLAEQAGVSNPYLSQVERGLRKPSAEVLNKIAAALQISAEHVYVRAGLLDDDSAQLPQVVASIHADPVLTSRQRQTLLDIYGAFVEQNRALTEPGDAASVPASETPSSADDGAQPTDVPDGHAGKKE